MNEDKSPEQLRAEIARLQAHNRELEAHSRELQARVSHRDEQEKRQRQAWMQEMFARGGEMGGLIAKRDWSSTSVGPVENWSQSMCMTLSLCLTSRFPMLLLWGPEYIQFYNDAYIPILGTKHPAALGQGVATSWPETWERGGPYLSIRENNELTFYQNARYNLYRHGYLEETYFTGTYSPLRDEVGRLSGLLSSTMETTQQVLLERRLHTLGELATRTASLHGTADVCEVVLKVIAEHPEDIPFALLYWLSDDGKLTHLKGCIGLDEQMAFSVPEQLVLSDIEASSGMETLAQVVHTHQVKTMDGLSPLLGDAPLLLHEQTVRSACVLPIEQGSGDRLAALLVAGISPYRAFDDLYLDFLQLVATQIGTALANARSHQEARARAEHLAALDRAKTSFFNNISHEFRTPLTLLLGPLEDLLSGSQDALPSSVHEQLSLVHRNALRLLKLVNTLLDFSRIEAGRIQASYTPTDLAALTRDLASMFRSAIEQAGLHYQVHCPSLPEPVYVDTEMWEKIVLNLLS
ncbi:MAG TPA: hypothetical protein DHW02_21600, partial [Ktedonobacter sp.]|nr:hypothetical protein [Ktedonobacter sp.]